MVVLYVPGDLLLVRAGGREGADAEIVGDGGMGWMLGGGRTVGSGMRMSVHVGPWTVG